jgi:predicted nuclease of predicted toxin-antitoxin system
MKLLFDQNLSHKLVRLLSDLFPESVDIRDVNLNAAEDSVIWDYAKANGFVIVSKDSDFHQRSFVYGFPPKVIWIKLGNCSTADIAKLLRANWASIESFYADERGTFLSLS